MKPKIIILFIITVVLLCSCKKEESEVRLGILDPPIVTGFYIRDIQGHIISVIGYPNIKREEVIGNTVFEMASYSGGNNIYVDVKAPYSNAKTNVWITPAIFEPSISFNQINTETINYFNSIALKAGGYPIFQIEKTLSGAHQMFAFNTIETDEGFYRVYVKVDNTLLWDNLLFIKKELHIN